MATGLALAAAPTGAGAFAPPAESEPSEVEPEPAEVEPAPTPEQPDAAPPDEVEVEIEEGDEPTGGGTIGGVVDADDPNATRAQSDLEGEGLDTDMAGVPERLPKLQAAGWWLVFGGVTLAASGGVLAGIAETREDEADRLAYGFSLATGKATEFGMVADEWDQTLREGQAFESAARGLVIGGAVVLLGGVGFFIADAVQRKRGRTERPVVRVQPSPSGMQLRF